MPLRSGERPEGQVPLETPAWMLGGFLTPRGQPLLEGDLGPRSRERAGHYR
jgi:hypothetical protein